MEKHRRNRVNPIMLWGFVVSIVLCLWFGKQLVAPDRTIPADATAWSYTTAEWHYSTLKRPDFGGNLRPGDEVYARELAEPHSPMRTYAAAPGPEGMWILNPFPVIADMHGYVPMLLMEGDYLIDVRRPSDPLYRWAMVFHARDVNR